MDPQTPVLVGACAVQQRCEHPDEGVEPVELMIRALERAAEDAGSRDLLARADVVRVPRGFWDYPRPGPALAERFGATRRAHPARASSACSRRRSSARAARDIAERARATSCSSRAARRSTARSARSILGVEAPLTRCEPASHPTRCCGRTREILQPARAAGGARTCRCTQYAMIENALRFAEKQRSRRAPRRDGARSRRARARSRRGNPDAWDRDAACTPTRSAAPAARNRMLAFPYTKLHNSQWNVDQAAGLILCSLETARALGLARGALRLPARGRRREPHGAARGAAGARSACPASRTPGRRALAHAGLAAAERGRARALQLLPGGGARAAARARHRRGAPLTVTGGMAFAGGPLNNFVLQALAKMVERAARRARHASAW